jgi:hypothetical protein
MEGNILIAGLFILILNKQIYIYINKLLFNLNNLINSTVDNN